MCQWGAWPQAADLLFVGGTVPAFIQLILSMRLALVQKEFGIDILALISIAGSVALNQYMTACVIAVMLVSGQALEAFAQRRAGRDMSALLNKAPKFANRLIDGVMTRIPLELLKIGDRLVVRSGEIVPIDGALLSATATLDESALSGESNLVEHRAGASIRSGGVNAATPFEILASSTAADSTYAGIVRLVGLAQKSKAPASRMADRYAMWFLPLSLGLAALAWIVSGDPLRALAVIVVATPCPLILAVPVAIVSGMSWCAKRGILIKGGAAIEKLGQANTIFFDKTGTLTGGKADLIHTEANADVSQTEILRLAASLDQMSGHVTATAVVAAARGRGIVLAIPSEIHEHGGAGLTGNIEGKTIVLGSYAFVSSLASNAPWVKQFLERCAGAAGSAVFVAQDGKIIGALLMADRIRLETPRSLRLLRKAGISRIVMLTGDRKDVAEAIGASLDVDQVYAEQSPADKQAAIEAARTTGISIMVGDGINDAPALTAADVGVAMGSRGAAASSEAADVVLLVDRLDRLAEALNAARQIRAIAMQSVIAGMAMSLVAMLFAALGYLPPLYGAALQEVIDVIVIVNALRALRISPLRASQHKLSGAQITRLKIEHEALAPILDQVRNLADKLPFFAVAEAHSALISMDSILQKQLLPHEQEDDLILYPTIATLLGGDDPMAAMSRTHQEIFEFGRALTQSVQSLSNNDMTSESCKELQRLLYGFEAILRLHFVQEEEIYQNLS
ncbi:heavy metal translocating P-type ATPase [Undibacterium sp. CCC2.1]|uniref:heavy metal translocating P-type ATPase n=1 Tax=unclassified Undibacterium TaxID=2630295 RepID=UPI002B22677B|nr:MULTISPECIES: heavy metal translocating P-type ATPase [unclassified Undibacterium]MEB0140432.1 heavy metal translocating P-type ATPase [Undibacterium sp. CCC2.1]MEB0173921.1 heavy metal translocating P-type ATPase [Undibacterium sp. CCC1.1]MEB0177399.1 heavy metal translocating P-type ATPase [Undibacterium sp. CCC3.4]MEB0217098.1 heavy metal translocating P-type ATPase [Undibacterium sp. 5I2]